MNIQNAIIRNADLCVSENYSKSLELWLELRLQDGGAVVFKVWGPYTEDWRNNQFAYSVKRILDIVGVSNLKELKNKPIRAKFLKDGGLGDIIIGIGDFLSENWFIPREEKLYKQQ